MASNPISTTRTCHWKLLKSFCIDSLYLTLIEACDDKHFVFVAKHGESFTAESFDCLDDAFHFFALLLVDLVSNMKRATITDVESCL